MNDRMQQTLLGLQEAYARQAARLDRVRAIRRPTADDVRGMAWFNGLSEQRREYWLQRAGSSRPVDAWHYFKLCEEVASQHA
jgi:hypothetical protein